MLRKAWFRNRFVSATVIYLLIAIDLWGLYFLLEPHCYKTLTGSKSGPRSLVEPHFVLNDRDHKPKTLFNIAFHTGNNHNRSSNFISRAYPMFDTLRIQELNSIPIETARVEKFPEQHEAWRTRKNPDVLRDIPEVEQPFPSSCDKGSDPFLLVVVLTTTEHRLTRNVIRNTWGSVARDEPWPHFGHLRGQVRLLFVMGHQSEHHPTFTDLLWLEQGLHGDMLFLNMEDSYDELVPKMISALRWVRINCPMLKFVMKSDEDTFVNMPLLVDFLFFKQRELTRSVIGHVLNDTLVYTTGKWAIPRELYPLRYYPNYSTGSSYILSADSLPDLLDAVPTTNVIRFEDLYITGLLAMAAGLTRYHTSAMSRTDDIRDLPKTCELFRSRLTVTDFVIAPSYDKLWLAAQLGYCRIPDYSGLDFLYRKPIYDPGPAA